MAPSAGRAGGVPAVLKVLAGAGLVHMNCMTVAGKTIGEIIDEFVAGDPAVIDGVLRPFATPMAPAGNHIRIITGSLAPKSAVCKVSGKQGVVFRGPARVFDSEQAAFTAITSGKIVEGQAVVIRYCGPKGGMPRDECLAERIDHPN